MSSNFDSKGIRAFGHGALALALALAISGCQAPSSTSTGSGTTQSESASQATSGLAASVSGQATQAASASGQATADPAKEQPAAPDPQVYAGDVADFEARRAQIEADSDSDPRNGGNMPAMRAASVDYASNLESLMNDIYAYALALPGVDTAALEAAQNEWVASWQARLDEMNAEFAEAHYSGNAFAIQANSEHAEYLNRRIDELLEFVYATTGVERGPSAAEINEQREEPVYTVRYRVSDGSFAGDYAYIPESPNACRAAYGDDCLTLQGYYWNFDVPGTEIVATYMEGAEDKGAVWVKGPLYQLVDGIGPDDSVPLIELAGHLVSSEGAFDLTQVDTQGKASPCGNCYFFNAGGGTKDYTSYTGSVAILFAEAPVDPGTGLDSQSVVLHVQSEGGYVSGQSSATLAIGLQ